MCLTECNEAETMALLKEEGREEGRQEGIDISVKKLMSHLLQQDPSLTEEEALRRAKEILA